MDCTPSKKQKVNEDTEYFLTFDQTHSLRILVDVISNILPRVEFTVIEKEKFKGISIESIDPKHVCLIVARLACNVRCTSKDAKYSFCVDTGTFNTCLKSTQPHFSLDIKKKTEESDITMSSYEDVTNSYFSTFSVPTLVSEVESAKLSEFDYKYTIEMDLNTLRNIVKNTLALKGNDIRLTVEEPVQVRNYTYNILTIYTDGNAAQKHQFHSVTEEKGGGNCVIRTEEGGLEIPEDEEMKQVYSECFSASYMLNFLKGMERQVISIRLLQGEGKPLILNYPLNTDDSYICFVLAAKAKE